MANYFTPNGFDDSDPFNQRKIAYIPQDPRTNAFLKAVDAQTKSDVFEQFDISITYDWYATTQTTVIIDSIISALSTTMKSEGARNVAMNFYNLFFVEVNTKTNIRAEKEGNINIAFEAGPVAEDLITTEAKKGDTPVEPVDPKQFFMIEDPDMSEDALAMANKMYYEIDRLARYNLSTNYGITISDGKAMTPTAVAYCYIQNIFRGLLFELGADAEKTLASVNFNDKIEFHAMRKDGGILFAMRPGLQAKLLIKSDEHTEDDDDTPWS